MWRRKKVVSKAQFRFFRDALRRIEAGGTSLIKDMSAEDLRRVLQGVDYDSLPERAGQAAPKPKPKVQPKARATMPVEPPRPEQWHSAALPDGTLSLDVYRVLHPETVAPQADDGDMGRVLSITGYLQRYPEKRRRDLPAAVGHSWFPALFRDTAGGGRR